MITPAIDVHDLVKRYQGVAVVDRVSLAIEKGKICGFLGPNGSGKTTTLRMICGLLVPDEGRGTCLGLDVIKDSFKIKRLIGYMPQKFGLYEDLTVFENLAFVARMYGMSPIQSVVTQAIEEMGLQLFTHKLAGSLSGGWKQRLALASCLMHNPQVLLLDEPTAGVDPKARRDFWDKIHELAAKGMTVLVSTHYMDEAERCHEIAYIYYGTLLAKGSIEQIIEESKLYAYVVSGDYLSLMNELKAKEGLIVAPFGTQWHLCSYDEKLLDASIEPYKKDPHFHWKKVDPTLEDIFIAMMSKQPIERGTL